MHKGKAKKDREELENIQRELERKMVIGGTIPLGMVEQRKEEIDRLFLKRNAILEKRSEAFTLKAKTKWFYEGERSYKYFLNLLRRRGALTEINALKTDTGTTTDEGLIKKKITEFYKNLYENEMQPVIESKFFEQAKQIDDTVARKIIMPLGKEEVHQVLKLCKDSAPGADGIPYSYYKQFWNFFGDTLIQAWKEGLEQGTLPPSHTNSLLRLLPKEGKDLTNIGNWRPIILSNCDHKLITKCYAIRLTEALRNILHPSQIAYLPVKQIQDNLRVINLVNKHSQKANIIVLDAKRHLIQSIMNI